MIKKISKPLLSLAISASIAVTASLVGCSPNALLLDAKDKIQKDTDSHYSALPTFSPPAGGYIGKRTVSISSRTENATIRYTTDGSDPTPSTGTVYTGPVIVEISETLKAIAYKSGAADSAVASAAYGITLAFAYVALLGNESAVPPIKGSVLSYAVDSATGALTKIGSAIEAGTRTYWVAADPLGRFVYVVDYVDQKIYIYSINPATGILSSTISAVSTPDRVTRVAVDPAGKFVFINGYSGGSISSYLINQSTGGLTLSSTLPTGEIIHMTSPSIRKNEAYMLLILAVIMRWPTYSIPATEAFRTQQRPGRKAIRPPFWLSPQALRAGTYMSRISQHNLIWAYTINPTSYSIAYTGFNVTAGGTPNSIASDPAFKYLYVANNSGASISQFSIKVSSTGALASIGPAVATGLLPGSIVVDPSGSFAYVANYSSDSISGYRIDSSTGVLTSLGSDFAVGVNPMSITITKAIEP